METHVRDRLLDLNRSFYDTFAGVFSDSRADSEPGFDRIVAQMSPGDRILDLGCGQARLAQLLPPTCTYVGVDYSLGMISVAQETIPKDDRGALSHSAHTRFVTADLVADAWDEEVGEAFDWIVLRAVLHHIPGYETRRQVVERATHLLAPHGRLVLANWQFLQVERLRRRILPWSTLDLTSEDVQPGDYLLDWRRQGHGLRYVHLIDDAETRELASEVGLHVAALFRADGHTNDLTLYAVLVR